VPVGTLAIGRAGAVNAALLAAAILAISDPSLAARLDELRAAQALAVPIEPHDPGEATPGDETAGAKTAGAQTGGAQTGGAHDPA
jgi:AIR carboxylase